MPSALSEIRQLLLTHQSVREVAPDWSDRLIDDYQALKSDVARAVAILEASLPLAAYGGIGFDGAQPAATVDVVFQPVTGFDEEIVDPLRVDNDLPDNGLRLGTAGVWLCTISLAMTFNAGPPDRLMQVFVGDGSVPLVIAAGQTNANISASIILTSTEEQEGDLLQIEVGTQGDTFNNVVILSGRFQIAHIGPGAGTV